VIISAQLIHDAIKGDNVTIIGYLEAIAAFNNAASMAYQNAGVAAGPSAAEGKIEALYQSVFGRNSDAGGLSYYSNLLRNGTSLSDIEAGLRNSDEYKHQSHVYSSQQSGTMGTESALEARFASLESAMNSVAVSSDKTAYLLQQVTNGGSEMNIAKAT
jgi:hypothetical protein